MQHRKPETLVITAGHYSLAPQLQDFSASAQTEQMSFRLGLLRHKQRRLARMSTKIVVWINDIGISPQERESLRAHLHLPQEYAEIAKEMGVPTSEIDILLESSMRNKASKLLRQAYRAHPRLFERMDAKSQDLVRCVVGKQGDFVDTCQSSPESKTSYVIDGPNEEKLVVKDGPNPKCNLILATLFQTLCKRYQTHNILAIFNEIYSYRLSLGLHVYRSIFSGNANIEVALCDERGLVAV